jgi:hypothetical protein
MITLNEFLADVQRSLDDENEEVWSKDQLANWAQHGYEDLCRGSQCLFDMVMFDAQPVVGNYTKEFEREFMEGPIFARFTHTRPSEAEYVSESIESNHTRPCDAQYMPPVSAATLEQETGSPTTSTLRRLPETTIAVDRVTHNWLRLNPEPQSYHRKTRQWYEKIEGGVFSYQMDMDGWQNLRLVNVPVTVVDTVSYSGVHGVIRQTDEYALSGETIVGSYGAMRVIPRHFSGQQYGVIRRIVPDAANTRVELYRLGNELTDAPFEIPDRAVKYVKWWVMARAYSQPGEGENKKLAIHFKERFKQGVDTIKNRINTVNRARTIAMGSKRSTGRDGYLQHFPANYGYSRPFGRG